MVQVPKHGLQVPFREGLLQHVAQDVVKLAKVQEHHSQNNSLRCSRVRWSYVAKAYVNERMLCE
jgi:hypothetical protein